MVLSGPVPAERLAEMSGGALVLAGPRDTTQALTSLFTLPGFSVYVSDDPVGVQAAATLAEVYSLLGSYLTRTKEMNGRLDTAAFFRETSDEALRLILALGGRKETFMADNPAWVAEYVAAGLGGPGAVFGRQAGRSRGWLSTSARE
jgi:glycerol-3-phosphate dehydrogenase